MASPNQLAWRKFRNNYPAMFGLGYVSLCVLVALFAYLLAPDHTRHANRQVLELAKLPPGSRASLLMVPKPGEPPAYPLPAFTGYPQRYLPIPLFPESTVEMTETALQYRAWSGAEARLAFADFPDHRPSPDWVSERYFLLGTDAYGRDLLSRIMLGARVSLAVGLMSVLISLLIGMSLGVLAGYFRGWVDKVVMWLVSVVWSIPTLLLALAISFVLGKGFWQLFLAIGLSMWVEVARIVRGQILSLREATFAEAATALGYRPGRIMFRHLLPNVLSPIIVIAVANFGAAVLIESGLSFLGIGVEVPIPSWGRMIYEGYTYIMFENGQWLAFFPGLALILLVVSINLIGIGLRDALDVRG